VRGERERGKESEERRKRRERSEKTGERREERGDAECHTKSSPAGLRKSPMCMNMSFWHLDDRTMQPGHLVQL
jgi:hypothetical protein